LLGRSEFVTVHVPLSNKTRAMIDEKRLRAMREGVVLLNFAREEIVDEHAMAGALGRGKVRAYVCDFPGNTLRGNPHVVMLPHIGASTVEAEENCAVMVADQVRAYLEDGTIHNSVNFPEVEMPRSNGSHRIAVVNANVPNMLGQISTTLASAGLNILDMLNKSRGELAFTLADVETAVPPEVVAEIASIDGVLAVRSL
jgi:D-3-phosphoglycerate dehydrogenase